MIYVILGIGCICFVINVYIIRANLFSLISGDLNVAEFKNGGGAQNKISLIVPPLLLTFTNVFSPLGYLTLALHFYFLIKGRNNTLALLSLFVALNIPLSGMLALSRAYTAAFVLEYFFFYLLFKDSFSNETKSILHKAVVVIGGAIAILFFTISYNRFSGSYGYYNVPYDSAIQDPIIYSAIDYFTQWVHNGVETLAIFDLSSLWYGKSFSVLIDRFIVVFNENLLTYVDARYLIIPSHASSFNGLVSTLTYDFSPVGCLFIMAIYFCLCRYFSASSDGYLKLRVIFALPFLLCMPVMFFMNNYAGYLSVQVGMLYTLLFLLLGRVRFG